MDSSCNVCGMSISQDDGSLFVGEDGEVYCNDHYPERETEH